MAECSAVFLPLAMILGYFLSLQCHTHEIERFFQSDNSKQLGFYQLHWDVLNALRDSDDPYAAINAIEMSCARVKNIENNVNIYLFPMGILGEVGLYEAKWSENRVPWSIKILVPLPS